MNQCAARIEQGAYIPLVMTIRFVTFYALPDWVRCLVRLAMTAAARTALDEQWGALSLTVSQPRPLLEAARSGSADDAPLVAGPRWPVDQ